MAALVAGVAQALEPRKLRVGVFADAPLQPRWVVEAFEQVARSDFAEIVCVVAGGPAPREPLLWRLYRSADRWAFGPDGGELTPLPNWGQGRRPEPDVLDVAFALGAVDEASLLGLARYGVWRFCFGNERAHAESLAGWREVVSDAPVTGSGIKVRLAADEPPRLAYQSWTRTYPLSLARNRARVVHKTAEFPWRALRALHREGPAWLERCPPVRTVEVAVPASGELLRAAVDIGGRILQRGLQKATGLEQWFLAWRFGEGRLASDLEGYTRAAPPRDRDWADPFAIEKHGRYFVFFEELPYAAGKAHISMIEVRADGGWSAPVRVLERDYHLSYPLLLEEGGELYMIPETAANGTVELYRCVDFPRRWKHERNLLEGVRLVDATLHRGRRHWWMFANAAASGSRVFDDELHVYYAESLFGPWQAHRANPVKSDGRSARPAGAVYLLGGALHRPAQICVPRYGAGMVIHRVTRLTPDEYAERPVERVLPAGGLLGLHTINRAGALTVVDAFARRSRFA